MAKNFILAIENEHAVSIRKRLKQEKKYTGKSIRRIVTDILMDDRNFLCLNNLENLEKSEDEI